MIASEMVLAITFSMCNHGTVYIEYTENLFMVLRWQTGGSCLNPVHADVIVVVFNNLVVNTEKICVFHGKLLISGFS